MLLNKVLVDFVFGTLFQDIVYKNQIIMGCTLCKNGVGLGFLKSVYTNAVKVPAAEYSFQRGGS
jgi:hypothetical protein